MKTIRVAGAFASLIVALGVESNAYAQATPSTGTLGQRAYKAICMGCHSIEPNVTKVGPSLAGLIGRKAGSPTGSAALRESGIIWDSKSLDAYLMNPPALVPGTTMVVTLEDREVRSALVGYIEELANPRVKN
ncbi:c-type cytochrome [Methyloversatilis discipulorum]|uniref:c-type cytochrome n=1 Tax=Methyloversatilis discipulorum TaxID=1119528 RepID=UPI0012FB73C9